MSGVTQNSVPGEVHQARQARRPELSEPPGHTEPAELAAAYPAPDPASGWVLPVLILVVGMFMSVLDVTIVNVAIPSIQKDFGGSLDDVLWIATGYTLTLGVVVPLSGWLGAVSASAPSTSQPCSAPRWAQRRAASHGTWTY